jgi:hypothetical protein
MTHSQNDAFVLSCILCKQGGCFRCEGAMLNGGFFGKGEGLEGFQEEVTEIMEKGFADLFDLGFTLVRKRVAEVIVDHLFAVAHHIVYDEVGKVREQV